MLFLVAIWNASPAKAHHQHADCVCVQGVPYVVCAMWCVRPCACCVRRNVRQEKSRRSTLAALEEHGLEGHQSADAGHHGRWHGDMHRQRWEGRHEGEQGMNESGVGPIRYWNSMNGVPTEFPELGVICHIAEMCCAFWLGGRSGDRKPGQEEVQGGHTGQRADVGLRFRRTQA